MNISKRTKRNIRIVIVLLVVFYVFRLMKNSAITGQGTLLPPDLFSISNLKEVSFQLVFVLVLAISVSTLMKIYDKYIDRKKGRKKKS